MSRLFVQETHAATAATHMTSTNFWIQTLEALLLHETSHKYQCLISRLKDTDCLAVQSYYAYCSLSLLVSQLIKPKYQLVSNSYLNTLLHYTNMFKQCS